MSDRLPCDCPLGVVGALRDRRDGLHLRAARTAARDAVDAWFDAPQPGEPTRRPDPTGLRAGYLPGAGAPRGRVLGGVPMRAVLHNNPRAPRRVMRRST
jgi:hypothetical protein